jgi:hypothetical protein
MSPGAIHIHTTLVVPRLFILAHTPWNTFFGYIKRGGNVGIMHKSTNIFSILGNNPATITSMPTWGFHVVNIGLVRMLIFQMLVKLLFGLKSFIRTMTASVSAPIRVQILMDDLLRCHQKNIITLLKNIFFNFL